MALVACERKVAIAPVAPPAAAPVAQGDAARREFLAAAGKASVMRIQALQPGEYDVQHVPSPSDPPRKPGSPPPPPETRQSNPDCQRVHCVGGQLVLGEVEVSARKLEVARTILGNWLRGSASRTSACVPDYRHAISFSQGGHDYALELCYGCGQYALEIDGEEREWGEGTNPVGQAELDELLAEGGVQGFAPAK